MTADVLLKICDALKYDISDIMEISSKCGQDTSTS